jgi:outer membrane lipoprotein-sorting protein
MNNPTDNIERRLGRLGERLAEQPSVVDRVMNEVNRAEPMQLPLYQGRIVTMLLKPQNLVAAAAVLALVVFGLRPWSAPRESGPGAWWLAPRSAWAAELHTAIQQAEEQGLSCREQFLTAMADGTQAISSTTSTLFVAGKRYRRDTYENGRLREIQWYEQGADGLTLTSVRYDNRTYTETRDPKANETDDSPLTQIEALARRLELSGRRVGTARVEGREAVEFEIAAKKLDAKHDEATIRVWLDQATKMPLKTACESAAPAGSDPIVGTIYVQDHFDWNPTLPANALQPQIPAGFTKAAAN